MSEPLLRARSTAASRAWAASSEPSVAKRIFIGKRFIFASFPLLPSGNDQARPPKRTPGRKPRRSPGVWPEAYRSPQHKVHQPTRGEGQYRSEEAQHGEFPGDEVEAERNVDGALEDQGQRRQHERRAQDRPDTGIGPSDYLPALDVELEDGHCRDYALRQRGGTHGREQAAHGFLLRGQPTIQHLDWIREEGGVEEDHDQGDHGIGYGRDCTQRLPPSVEGRPPQVAGYPRGREARSTWPISFPDGPRGTHEKRELTTA